MRKDDECFINKYILEGADSAGLSKLIDSPVFTPTKDSMINFAALTYLFGLLDFKIDSFTAVPNVCFAMYETGNISSTFFIG